MTQETAYERYISKVTHARKAGYSDEAILTELRRERETIMPRCKLKQATLVRERTPYKSREVARLASECMNAIDRIIKELDKKEIKV